MTRRRRQTETPATDSRRRPTDAEHYDIPALMRRWRVSYDYVWSALVAGELAGMRLGRAWRVSPDAVAAYEAARTTAA